MISGGSSIVESPLSVESQLRLNLETALLELEVEKSINTRLRVELDEEEPQSQVPVEEHPTQLVGGYEPRDAGEKLDRIVQEDWRAQKALHKTVESERKVDEVDEVNGNANYRVEQAEREAETEKKLNLGERILFKDELNDGVTDIPEGLNNRARQRRRANRSFHIWGSMESRGITGFAGIRMTAMLRDSYVIVRRLLWDSTLVTFRAGLEVVSVTGGFDNGFIAIHGLPLDVRMDEIEAMFQGSRTRFCIHDTRQHGDGTISATVIVEETQKQSLVNRLNGKKIRNKTVTANIIDVAGNPPMPPYTLSLTWDFLSPRHIGSTVSEFYLQEFYVRLRRELESSAGLSSYAFSTPSPKGSRNTAIACFRTWASAKKMHDKLAGRRLKPYFPVIQCSLRPNEPKTKYALSIPLQLHNIHGLVSVVKRGVSENTSEVDGITTPVQFLSSGWFDGWGWSSDLKTVEFFEYDLVRRDLRIAMIKRDWLTQTLTFYGTTKGAVQSISNEVERFARRSDSVHYSTPIKGRSTQSFHASSEFAALKEELGEDAVWLDVESSVCMLKYRGRPRPSSSMERILNDIENYTGHSESEEKVKCHMCSYKVGQSIEMACGHDHCVGCLRLYVLSVQSRNRYPMTCPGNDYQCQELITIPIIQSLLSPTEFEVLLETVAESHIMRHRNQYKYCVTANCMQMYCYTDENPRFLTCPSCSISFCSVCRTKPHGKEPCALMTLDDKP